VGLREPPAREGGGTQQRVIWLLDVEAMRARPLDPGLVGTPALARYLSRTAALDTRANSIWSFASWQTARDSWRSVDATIFGNARPLSKRTCSIRTNGVTEYAADGYRSFDFHDVAVQRGMPLARLDRHHPRRVPQDLRRGYAARAVGRAPLRADHRGDEHWKIGRSSS